MGIEEVAKNCIGHLPLVSGPNIDAIAKKEVDHIAAAFGKSPYYSTFESRVQSADVDTAIPRNSSRPPVKLAPINAQ